MFQSIRWRLVASYVLLTLLTVTMLGAIGFSLFSQYVKRQEEAFLANNAEVVAEQALPFIWPVVNEVYLSDLATAASILGNFRVIILDVDQEVLIDTGTPSGIDQFLWIQPGTKVRIETLSLPSGPFIFPAEFQAELESQFLHEFPLAMLGETQARPYKIIQRVLEPWGYQFRVVESSSPPDAPEDLRSSSDYMQPIGNSADPLGYVVLKEGPDFGSETLKTAAQVFLLAALGAIVLAAIIGLIVSKRLTSPIVNLSGVAAKMGCGDLSSRAPAYGKDEIGQLAIQFNNMANRLEANFQELAKERDTLQRFITDASHELRTPITALKNFNELLQGKAIENPQTREAFLIESQHQLERLEWITENLLNISRLDAGLTELNIEQIDAGDILQASIAPYTHQAEAKGIDLAIEKDGPSITFDADRMLVELALSNLIDNAIKFTPSGGSVLAGYTEDQDSVHLWVQDTGPGIDPEDIPYVFERFYRGKGTTEEGSGLGLAMVVSVVLAHRGKVDVESEIDGGSRFSLLFPQRFGEPEVVEPSDESKEVPFKSWWKNKGFFS